MEERWGKLDPDGTRLAWLDAGGQGPPVVLLHGLAGHAREWRDTAQALSDWPVPFASRQVALDYFGGDTPKARAWTDRLEERSDGWWPRFDLEVMVASVAELAKRTYWE